MQRSFPVKPVKAAKVVAKEQLLEHAKMEEVVTYPTAILIGEYLKLKLK